MRDFLYVTFPAAEQSVQKRMISRVLGGTGKAVPPWFLRLFIYFPVLRRLPARLMGLGVRREHVRSLVIKGPGADQL
jgi:hypothetical protein